MSKINFIYLRINEASWLLRSLRRPCSAFLQHDSTSGSRITKIRSNPQRHHRTKIFCSSWNKTVLSIFLPKTTKMKTVVQKVAKPVLVPENAIIKTRLYWVFRRRITSTTEGSRKPEKLYWILFLLCILGDLGFFMGFYLF